MIDLIASRPQYLAHVTPIWDALPTRGAVVTDRKSRRSSAVLVASGRDLARARTIGYRKVVLVEHGIGQSYPNAGMGYPGGKGRDNVSLFLSPNDTAAANDARVYPKATVTAIGDPRLDTLLARQPGPPRIAISFHWNGMNLALSAISHYRHVLGELAKAYPMIGHCHPFTVPTITPLYRRFGIPFEPSFDAVCRQADLYIADNTSTLYEFASTGRPVVVLNRPDWDRDVELGLRFWAASRVGLNVDDPSQLVEVVARALVDLPEVQADREAALSIAYAYRSGAAQRAVDAITGWLA